MEVFDTCNAAGTFCNLVTGLPILAHPFCCCSRPSIKLSDLGAVKETG